MLRPSDRRQAHLWCARPPWDVAHCGSAGQAQPEEPRAPDALRAEEGSGEEGGEDCCLSGPSVRRGREAPGQL